MNHHLQDRNAVKRLQQGLNDNGRQQKLSICFFWWQKWVNFSNNDLSVSFCKHFWICLGFLLPRSCVRYKISTYIKLPWCKKKVLGTFNSSMHTDGRVLKVKEISRRNHLSIVSHLLYFIKCYSVTIRVITTMEQTLSVNVCAMMVKYFV